ncbi:abortive phage infection protein [Coriobacteriales bacterium OH1046]|nr:abortive phage infection protein [Coriobacteriales bacterium OH1046]
MSRFEELKSMAGQNGGVLQTSAVVAAGISKSVLADFVRRNHFERVVRGVYCSPDCWRDDMYLLQLRCPQTIFSHDTALFLLDMAEHEPLHHTVTAKTGYNPSHLTAEGVKVFTVKKGLFHLGATTAGTPSGHAVTIYGPERTLCDMIRSRNSVEIQMLRDALKQYVRRRDKNLHVLMEYAELFHVERRLGQYLEVLL